MHPVINALTELHYRLEEAHQLLEKVADEYNMLLKENIQLKDKLFWQDDADDGKC
jgi:fatty acid desaturase